MKSKKIKRIGMSLLLIGLCLFGFTHLEFKSVDTYKKEQQSLLLKQGQTYKESEQSVEVSGEQEYVEQNSQAAVQESNSTSKSQNDTKDNVNTQTTVSESAHKNERKKTLQTQNSSTIQSEETTKTKNVTDKVSSSQANNDSISYAQQTTSKKQNETKTTDNKEQQNAGEKEETTTQVQWIDCKIAIDCSILLENMDQVEDSMKPYIPEDGMLLKEQQIQVEQGQSAYDVLVLACKLNDIAYDAEYEKLYNSCYVKGIGYLYEKKSGKMSGWLYQVNGKTPNIGASSYIVKPNDTITWLYTCSGKAGS